MIRFLKVLLDKCQTFIFRLITAVSFLMLPISMAYIIYSLIINFDISRVIAGCLSLCSMTYINKSL